MAKAGHAGLGFPPQIQGGHMGPPLHFGLYLCAFAPVLSEARDTGARTKFARSHLEWRSACPERVEVSPIQNQLSAARMKGFRRICSVMSS